MARPLGRGTEGEITAATPHGQHSGAVPSGSLRIAFLAGRHGANVELREHGVLGRNGSPDCFFECRQSPPCFRLAASGMNPILPVSPVHPTTTGKKLCTVPLRICILTQAILLSCHAVLTAIDSTA